MKKFAKISLAAAVAVAGLSSVASAKPLEEAIKGVDATGYVTYRMDHQDYSKPSNTASKETHNYKAAMTLTIPATEDVNVKLQGVVWGQGLNGKDSTKTNETNPSTDLMEANFVYTGVENLTVIAGKQAINTPWTEGTSHINKTNSGTGALALYNAGFATFAAAHFTAHNVATVANTDTNAVNDVNALLGGGQNITVAAAIIPIMDVATAQIWYADFAKDSNAGTLKKGADALTVSADINLMDLAKLNVGHSTLDANDDAILKKQKLTKAVLSGSVDIVNLAAGYAKGGKDGAIVAFDSDASAAFKGWRVHTNANLKDIKAYMLKADVNVMDNLNLALTHVSAKADVAAKGKNKETYAQATYKFASNLSAYLRYGTQKDELVDGSKAAPIKSNNTRLEVAFKF
ncbi:major outer membrane protein [Arcobacter sp. FWKO B]|uniref:major outer membrane protein n=1 Tax=Arcobacter sp. FWKO B TaxID=2593672 RepID=UPI0018A3C065|nr:major outer membrane protein [Arcobacter sp. FWKO B]QOG12689.1 major outer membrane protein [Arcobacter sp. FWKO B]